MHCDSLSGGPPWLKMASQLSPPTMVTMGPGSVMMSSCSPLQGRQGAEAREVSRGFGMSFLGCLMALTWWRRAAPGSCWSPPHTSDCRWQRTEPARRRGG